MKKFWLDPEFQSSYRYAKELTREYARSFYFAARFLPEKTRWATYSVYGLCRYADNIVDKPRNRNKESVLEELGNFQKELVQAYTSGESMNPVISAFVKSSELYGIPQKYALELIKGVEMDMSITRYKTFDDLYLFCYRVASVVGLMMTYVLGFRDEEARAYAEKLGIAMQLTNILRDIDEDMEMGRIYIPEEEYKSYGLTEQDFYNRNFNDNFRELMKFQVDRAARYYREAEPGINLLKNESQFAIYAASRIYGGILNKIEENDYNPFEGRVFVPHSKKVRILGNEFFRLKAQNFMSNFT